MKRSRSGFTLVELLVVIGLIAVLAGVLGLALGRGNSGAALQSSQATLQGLFASARGQAAINQKSAVVVVNITPGEGYLREFHVLVDGRAVSGAVTLSQGIYVVPSVNLSNAQLADDSMPKSTLAWGATITNPTGLSGSFAPIYSVNERGVPASFEAGSNRLVLAPAERIDANTIRFNNPDAVRGVTVSRYGVLTPLNDAEAM